MNKTTGVEIPAEIAARSAELKKEKKPLKTSQVNAFQKAKLLNFGILDLTRSLPKKLTKLSDQMLTDSSELMKSIALANESRIPKRAEERVFYLSSALGAAFTLSAYISNLRHLSKTPDKHGNISVYIDQDDFNKLNKVCDNVIAQLTAWRDSTERGGHAQ